MGASWEPLGGLLEPLEGLLGPLGAVLKVIEKSIDFKHPLGSKKEGGRHVFWPPILAPKSTQDGTRNESKSKTIFKSDKSALQERLGAVLGRSWVVLGAVLGSKKPFSYWKT